MKSKTKKPTKAVKSSGLSVVAGSAWAALWTSKNKFDGLTRHLIYENGVPALFSKRRFARNFIRAQYGYIATRADLRAEPHGWRLPVAVKVTVALSSSHISAQTRAAEAPSEPQAHEARCSVASGSALDRAETELMAMGKDAHTLETALQYSRDDIVRLKKGLSDMLEIFDPGDRDLPGYGPGEIAVLLAARQLVLPNTKLSNSGA